MSGGRTTTGPGCSAGCLILIVLFFLVPFIGAAFSVLFPIVALFLLAYLLVLLWHSGWPLRVKQAITGAMVYPAGAWYLCRYSCVNPRVKLGAVVLAGLGTALIIHDVSFVPPVMILFGLTFLAVFLGADYNEPLPEAARRSGRYLRIRDLKNTEWRRLLEIEEAESVAERRLLLAREFSRLAERVLVAVPTDHTTWPAKKDLSTLGQEVDLLVASATDPLANQLPERVEDSDSGAELMTAIRALDGYVSRLSELRAASTVDIEHVRLLVRERNQLQKLYDDVLDHLKVEQLVD